jgi:hypothetical protein
MVIKQCQRVNLLLKYNFPGQPSFCAYHRIDDEYTKESYLKQANHTITSILYYFIHYYRQIQGFKLNGFSNLISNINQEIVRVNKAPAKM